MPLYNTSDNKKLLFLNIPSCAGTSINDWCAEYISSSNNVYSKEELDEMEAFDGLDLSNDEGIANLMYDLTGNKYALYDKLKEAAQDNYFSFTVIRNPWDRAVSMYLQFLEWRTFIKESSIKDMPFATSPIFNDDCDFEQFLEILSNPTDHYIPNIVKTVTRNQVDWLTSPVDHTIRYENLQLGFRKVQEYLGNDTVLKHRPPRRGYKHWREFYNDKTKSMVEQIFAKDINHFNYTFN